MRRRRLPPRPLRQPHPRQPTPPAPLPYRTPRTPFGCRACTILLPPRCSASSASGRPSTSTVSVLAIGLVLLSVVVMGGLIWYWLYVELPSPVRARVVRTLGI